MFKLKIYFSLLFATTVAYGLSVKYGFSQDDWYFLSISTARNLGDILNFFNPWNQSGFAFYRPLGTQLYYYLARLLLGLDGAPFGMHIFMLLIQSVNSYLVFRLVKKITRDRTLPILTGLIYATASAHFLSLYYIAATQQLLAAFFALLALNAHLDKHRLKSAIWFVLALMSKEVAIVTPIIMLLSELRMDPRVSIKKLFTSLIPVGIVAGLYVIFRLFGGLPSQAEYHLVFNGSVISTARWYFLFGYGAPEELLRYGLPRMGINYRSFITDFGWRGIILGLAPITIGVYGLAKSWRRPLYLAWWLVALLPVIFLENHRYPHYVDLGLVPLILLTLEDLPKRLQYILSAIMIGVSLLAINLSVNHHWTTKRALQSSDLSASILQNHACDDPLGISFRGSKPSVLDISYALSLENGPRVICNNQSLPVYYEGIYP